MHTKNGESGNFDVNKLSRSTRKILVEQIYSNVDRVMKDLHEEPPVGLRPVKELTVDIEVDETVEPGYEVEDAKKNEVNPRGKNDSGKKKPRKTTKAVKMVFHWETSWDPLPSKAFQNWGK